MFTIDRERLVSEKRKASAAGARLLKEAMLLRDIYKPIPGRVSSFKTHQQGLLRAKRCILIIPIGFMTANFEANSFYYY